MPSDSLKTFTNSSNSQIVKLVPLNIVVPLKPVSEDVGSSSNYTGGAFVTLTNKQMRGPLVLITDELSHKCRWLFMAKTTDHRTRRQTKD